MTTVSVIVPAYQAADFVGKAVRSALSQTFTDLEVIVVDDGSSDGTADAAALAGRNDPRLKVIRLPRNGGVSAARNAALQVARGTWIALLDADDVFAADRLARLLPAARKHRADVFADHVLLDIGSGAPEPLFTLPRRDFGTPMSARRFIELDSPTRPLGFMKPLIRRGFLEQHHLRYPVGIHAGEDFHLYVSCLLRGARLFWTGDAAYIATARAGSLSRSGEERAFAMFERSAKLLSDEALRCGDTGAVTALARRSADVRSYGGYTRLSAAIHARRFSEAFPIFCALSLQPYTWRRFATAARRRLFPEPRNA
jgi:glycosyltransferase involved in cell wall biosynthesis